MDPCNSYWEDFQWLIRFNRFINFMFVCMQCVVCTLVEALQTGLWFWHKSLPHIVEGLFFHLKEVWVVFWKSSPRSIRFIFFMLLPYHIICTGIIKLLSKWNSFDPLISETFYWFIWGTIVIKLNKIKHSITFIKTYILFKTWTE